MSLYTWDGRKSLAVVQGREEPARWNSFLNDNPQLHDSRARTQRRSLGLDRAVGLLIGAGLIAVFFGPFLGLIAFLALTR